MPIKSDFYVYPYRQQYKGKVLSTHAEIPCKAYPYEITFINKCSLYIPQASVEKHKNNIKRYYSYVDSHIFERKTINNKIRSILLPEYTIDPYLCFLWAFNHRGIRSVHTSNTISGTIQFYVTIVTKNKSPNTYTSYDLFIEEMSKKIDYTFDSLQKECNYKFMFVPQKLLDNDLITKSEKTERMKELYIKKTKRL